MIVPNQFPADPLQPGSLRLAIVGETPGETEQQLGRPFCGASGQLLDGLLGQLGIARSQVFAGNVCQRRPEGNKWRNVLPEWHRDGLQQLERDLVAFVPNCCLLLGNAALHSFCGPALNIDAARGTLAMGHLPGGWTGKVCASYHPRDVLVKYERKQPLLFDLRRALEEARSLALVLPQRELLVDLGLPALLAELDALARQTHPVSPDIEGDSSGITMISLTNRIDRAVCVYFKDTAGRDIWQPFETEQLWQAVERVLVAPQVPKVFQNGLYDCFCIAWLRKFRPTPVWWDTMISGWELLPELPKGLGFQASIWTREPAWKQNRVKE